MRNQLQPEPAHAQNLITKWSGVIDERNTASCWTSPDSQRALVVVAFYALIIHVNIITQVTWREAIVSVWCVIGCLVLMLSGPVGDKLGMFFTSDAVRGRFGRAILTLVVGTMSVAPTDDNFGDSHEEFRTWILVAACLLCGHFALVQMPFFLLYGNAGNVRGRSNWKHYQSAQSPPPSPPPRPQTLPSSPAPPVVMDVAIMQQQAPQLQQRDYINQTDSPPAAPAAAQEHADDLATYSDVQLTKSNDALRDGNLLLAEAHCSAAVHNAQFRKCIAVHAKLQQRLNRIREALAAEVDFQTLSVTSWTSSHVAAWLFAHSSGYAHLNNFGTSVASACLTFDGVDGMALLALNSARLRALGVQDSHERATLLADISALDQSISLESGQAVVRPQPQQLQQLQDQWVYRRKTRACSVTRPSLSACDVIVDRIQCLNSQTVAVVVDKRKKYPCPHCPIVCRRPQNLEAHIRTHTGEKPFVCGQCNKGFARSSNLKRHQRTHKQLRDFLCILCSRGFSDRSNLQAHLRGVHSLDKDEAKRISKLPQATPDAPQQPAAKPRQAYTTHKSKQDGRRNVNVLMPNDGSDDAMSFFPTRLSTSSLSSSSGGDLLSSVPFSGYQPQPIHALAIHLPQLQVAPPPIQFQPSHQPISVQLPASHHQSQFHQVQFPSIPITHNPASVQFKQHQQQQQMYAPQPRPVQQPSIKLEQFTQPIVSPRIVRISDTIAIDISKLRPDQLMELIVECPSATRAVNDALPSFSMQSQAEDQKQRMQNDLLKLPIADQFIQPDRHSTPPLSPDPLSPFSDSSGWSPDASSPMPSSPSPAPFADTDQFFTVNNHNAFGQQQQQEPPVDMTGFHFDLTCPDPSLPDFEDFVMDQDFVF